MSHIYGCGTNSDKSISFYFRMQNNGQFKFFKKINGNGNDECRGISYDQSKSESTLLMLTASTNLKDLNTLSTDAVLIQISDSGIVSRGKHISLS